MANPNVEYLGVMAWAAQFQWIADKIAPGDRVQIQCNASKIRVGDEVSYAICKKNIYRGWTEKF